MQRRFALLVLRGKTWCQLSTSMNPARVAATAARHGILVHPLDHYRASPAEADPPALVMGYSRLTPHQIDEGIQHLARIA